jgi:hypothetical protein
MLTILKFVLNARFSHIILNLNEPLEIFLDSAMVVGAVAKSEATQGEILPAFTESVSKNPDVFIDTVKYAFSGSAGETLYNDFGSTVAIVFKSFVLCTYLYELFIKGPTRCANILAGIVGHVPFFAVHFDVCLVRTAVSA